MTLSESVLLSLAWAFIALLVLLVKSYVKETHLRAGLSTKSNDFSSKESEIASQHLHSGSQPSVTQVL